jgi:hypothetical protein
MGIGPLVSTSLGATELAELRVVLAGWQLGDVRMYLAFAPGRSRLRRVRHVADALAELAGRIIVGLASGP